MYLQDPRERKNRPFKIVVYGVLVKSQAHEKCSRFFFDLKLKESILSSIHIPVSFAGTLSSCHLA